MGSGMGWQCPGCGRCYSPRTLECGHCNRARDRGPHVERGVTSLSYCMKCGAMTFPGQAHQCKEVTYRPDGIG